MFKLKNYTTSVSADRSIMEIEQLLAGFGADKILKDYMTDGKCIGVSFKLNGMGYKLPANVEGVHGVLWGQKRERHGTNNMKNREDQSYRVAWRIIRDWLHSQLSLIASGQALPDQILMPYMYDGKKTLYESYKEGRLALPKAEE